MLALLRRVASFGSDPFRLNLASFRLLAALSFAGCSCEDEPEPPPDGTSALRVLQPRPNGIAAARVDVVARVLRPEVDLMVVSAEGEELIRAPVVGLLAEGAFLASRLAAGRVILDIDAYVGEEAIERQSITVMAEPDPPSVRSIGPAGGALGTEGGVVLLIPPGAVDGSVELRLEDRPLPGLPAELRARGIEPRLAVDFLPATGTPDPSFRLQIPAQIFFPGVEVSALSSSDEVIVAMVEDAAGLGVLNVGEAGQGSGYVTGRPPLPPEILEVRNRSAPGAPLRWLDLAELVLAYRPPVASDLEVQVGSRVASRIIGASGESSVLIVLPPGSEGSAVTLGVIDRQSGLRAEREIELLEREEEPLDLAAADALIAAWFDGIDAFFGLLAETDFSVEPGARAAQSAQILERLRVELDDPVAKWRARLRDERARLEAADDSVRLQVAGLISTVEINRAALEGPSGALSTFERVLCFGTLLGGMYLQYLDWATPVWTSPKDAATSIGSGLAGGSLADAVINSPLCFPPSDPRRRGISKFECDVVGTPRDGYEGSYEGDGFEFGGDPDDPTAPPTMERLRGAERVELREPGGGDPQTGDEPIIVPPRSSWTVRLVVPDAEAVVVQTSTLGPYRAIDPGVLRTPARDEIRYLPLFFRRVSGPGPSDRFELQSGSQAGLRDESGAQSTLALDVEGDGDLDLFFAGSVDFEPGGFTVSYLALNQGNGVFQSAPLGPFPDFPPLLGRTGAADLDGDGDLDLYGLPHLTSLGQLTTLEGSRAAGNGTFEPAVWADWSEEDCGEASGLAVGDFVAGQGPDILLVSTFSESEIGEPVTGTRCLLVNRGDGTFAVNSTASAGYGFYDRSLGVAADVDADGALDAWFPRLGLVSFGDGQGGFLDVFIESGPCFDRSESSRLRLLPGSGPLLLDDDRDGRLDLLLDQTLTTPETGACVHHQSVNRSFAATALPRIELPAIELTTHQLAVTDLDSDGRTDLVWTGPVAAGIGQIGLFSRGPGGFVDDGAQIVSRYVMGLTPVELDGDGRPELILMGAVQEPDRLARVLAPARGRFILVRAESALGVPKGREALISVDLDGDGDFDPGEGLVTVVGELGDTLVGIGERDRVDVRVRFVDRPPAGGNLVVVRGVEAGRRLVAVDPQ